MARYFEIEYAFVDKPKEKFYGTVKDTHDAEEWEDDNVFFYGLDESNIREAIDSNTPIGGEFYIYDYQEQI